jgi:hypothetical protein
VGRAPEVESIIASGDIDVNFKCTDAVFFLSSFVAYEYYAHHLPEASQSAKAICDRASCF